MQRTLISLRPSPLPAVAHRVPGGLADRELDVGRDVDRGAEVGQEIGDERADLPHPLRFVRQDELAGRLRHRGVGDHLDADHRKVVPQFALDPCLDGAPDGLHEFAGSSDPVVADEILQLPLPEWTAHPRGFVDPIRVEEERVARIELDPAGLVIAAAFDAQRQTAFAQPFDLSGTPRGTTSGGTWPALA